MVNALVFKFILKCVRPFRKNIFGQALVSIIWAIDISLRPYLLKLMVNTMQGEALSESYNSLLFLGGVYIFMALSIVLIFRVWDYLWLHFNPPLKRHICMVLMTRMMEHSHHFYQDQFAGALANKVKDSISGIPDIIKQLLQDFMPLILALMIAIGVFWQVNSQFALGLFCWITIYLSGTVYLSLKGKHLSEKSAEIRSAVVGRLVDVIGNMVSVRFFSTRKLEEDQLKTHLDDYVYADQARDWFFLKLFAFQGFSFVIFQGLCLFWLIQGYRDGSITPGDFVLILTINISIIDFMWSLSNNIRVFTETLGNVTQSLNMALSPIEIQDIPHATSLKISQGSITFDKVHFHHKGAEPLFKNKSVIIPAGQKVGLVGYSGGGKSTFVNLILRLYDVTGGHILIDGQDIREVTQESLHTAIGMIPQDPALFHRSLMDNIRYGRMDATDNDVIDAAKRAHAHDFIMALPKSYGSLVGERGVKLSGGQRQRIAIARAFLKNAPILILDEATSQLDSLTEKIIQESLWELMQGKTTLVIAHRLSTLLHMDRILVFDKGKIMEDGTHSALLSNGGLYKNLWEAQVGGFLGDRASDVVGGGS